ncbi:MAG: adenosylcobinamide-GDP ribazoletransferase, partial [Mahellales bacterium]
MRKLILVFQFFTRIPIPSNSKASANNFGAAMKLLPVVGAAIGGMMWLTYRVLSPFDTLVASVAAVLLELVLTGGIHQDGLGDTFDGLFSNTNGQRMLDIMKDSRLGTHGVLAIVGVLLVKISVINALAEPCVLVAMPVFSRLAMVFGTALSGKSRGGGLGHLFISQVGPIDAVLSGL